MISDKNLKESKSELSMKIETMNSTKEMKKTFGDKSNRSKRSSFKSLNDNDYLEVKNLAKKDKSRSSLAVVAPDVH